MSSIKTQPSREVQAMMNRLTQLKQQHMYQINLLDLNLETTPRDSRYSNNLMEMMKKEEALLKDSSSPATKAILQKVDDSLRAETKSFFHKLVSQNLKKYELLQEKFARDREQFREELLKELQLHHDSSSSSSSKAAVATNPQQELIGSGSGPPTSTGVGVARPFSPNHLYSLEDIEREEERLQIDYYNHWYEYETLHLQEAFRLQSAKIDSDWLQHEIQLKTEFENKKAPFLPKSSTSSHEAQLLENQLSATAPQPSRWHNAEKQKTLIHTAPVFTPSSHQLSRPSSSVQRNNKNKDSQNISNALELDRLEREYHDALALLLRQKGDAKRWLMRQQIRLNAQCDEVKREKVFLGQLLTAEAKEAQFMQAKVQQLLAKSSSSTTSNPNITEAVPVLSNGYNRLQSQQGISKEGSLPDPSSAVIYNITNAPLQSSTSNGAQYPRLGNRHRTYTT